MSDENNQNNNKLLIYRIILAITGITFFAIGISFMRYAVFGVDPMSCLNLGISRQIVLSFGTTQLIVCFIMLVGIFFCDKSKIGFGTIYVMAAAGYTSDLFLWLITQIQFMEIFSIQLRIAAFSIGLFFYFFGAAVYIESKIGLSPYDAVTIIISEKIKKPDWFKWIRIVTDALYVIGGVLTESDVGAGTLILVLLGGPLISFFRKLLLKMKLYQNFQNKEEKAAD